MILGLMSTEKFAAERFKNIRRSVFYQYPQGAAPLIGLLSLMDEEKTNDPEFVHYEDRMVEKKIKFIASGTGFKPSSGLGPNHSGAAQTTLNVGTVYWLALDTTASGFDIENVRAQDLIMLKDINGADYMLQVIDPSKSANSDHSANDQSGYIKTATATYLAVTPVGDTGNSISVSGTGSHYNNAIAYIVGNAAYQGQVGSAQGRYTLPVGMNNNTQIFRTPFSFTGSAMTTSAKFDKSGPFADKAKKKTIDHMIDLELAFLFGVRSKQVTPGTDLPLYTMGGILSYLKAWDAGDGNTAGGIVNAYQNAGAGSATPADFALSTNDERRVYDLTGVGISEKQYDLLHERLFRFTNNTSSEKLCLCGSGFLRVINGMLKGKSEISADFPSKDSYGMSVVKHVTTYGDIYYKTHPLFNRSALLRNNALFLDVPNLKYRYMEGRDTEWLTGRAPNNADYRLDEWLTDAGLELRFPESHMYIQNLTDWS